MPQMITDQGKPTEIEWTQNADEIWVLPKDVPREDSTNKQIGPMDPLAVDTDLKGTGEIEGVYQADWFLSLVDGLTAANVQYIQGQNTPTPQIHKIVEFMQWQHLRLIIDRGPEPFPAPLPIPLPDIFCKSAYKITKPGTRTSDNKRFGWAIGAYFPPLYIKDPRSPDTIFYKVMVSQSFLFGAPKADLEPSSSVVAVKVYPVLAVTIKSSDPVSFPPPSFAADLKMEFAPRLTRDDQHRPDVSGVPQYPSPGRRDQNVVSLFCDNNNIGRGIPSPSFPPTTPTWDVVFDYGEPDIQGEIEFDAVLYPRRNPCNQPNPCNNPDPCNHTTDPYFLFGPIASQAQLLECQRVDGQGEFDNVHIHPWVGFDDPSGAGNTGNTSIALVEAPIAADEVIHLHWRWGLPIPTAAQIVVDKGEAPLGFSAAIFRGYSNPANQPNAQDGAPLIPINQSLRVKIADPKHDVTYPTGGPLNSGKTAVWYSPTFHKPDKHGYTQFCGHGFGFAYRFKDVNVLGLTQSNSDLLDNPTFVISYHGLRWTSGGGQRVPTASSARPPGLSRNRLDPCSQQHDFNFG